MNEARQAGRSEGKHSLKMRVLSAILTLAMLFGMFGGLGGQRKIVFADDEITIPSAVFADESTLAALGTKYAKGLYDENAGLESDDAVKMYLGNRPQDEYYYDDNYSGNKKPAPQGDMIWRFAGMDSDGGYVFYSEQPIVGCKGYMTRQGTDIHSVFLPKGCYTSINSTFVHLTDWAPVTSAGEHFSDGSTTAAQVYQNHWGGTINGGIRATLKNVLASTNYFKSEETGVMATKLVTTKVGQNSSNIDTTADKLWCGWAKGSGNAYKSYYLSTTQGEEKCAVYYDNWDGRIWMRHPNNSDTNSVLYTYPTYGMHAANTTNENPAVSAAFELDTTNFNFMAAAKAGAEGLTPVVSEPVMNMRMTGGEGKISASGSQLTYTAPAGSRLMAVISDGTNSWQYCQTISTAATNATLDISTVLPDDSGTVAVKAWVEQDVDGCTRLMQASSVVTTQAKPLVIPSAVFADESTLAKLGEKYPSGLYAQDANLEANDAVKIYLGRRPQDEYYQGGSDGSTKTTAPKGEMVWRFAGKDGDNGGYIFYSEQPIVGSNNYMDPGGTGRSDGLTSRFLQSYKTSGSTGYNPNNWAPDASKGEHFDGGSTTAARVYANHWGGTITRDPSTNAILGIRGTLAAVLSNEDWFKSEETDVMATKLVTTQVGNNSSNIDTTADKLWCGWAENTGIKVYYLSTTQGQEKCAVYLDNWDGAIWLRSALHSNSNDALYTWPGNHVHINSVTSMYRAVSAAFELDTTNFSFMAATPNTAGTGISKVAAGTPMNIRLRDGQGSVSASGDILTYSAPGGSRLMVLATDGTNTYQFCKSVGRATTDAKINLNQIGLSAGSRYAVKAWIEQDVAGSLMRASGMCSTVVEPIAFSGRVFVTKADLAALSEKYPNGLYAENANLEAGDEVKLNLGRRPQVEYYYDSDYSGNKKPAPAGEITWRFAGKDGDNGGYIFYSEQPIVGSDRYMSAQRTIDGLTSIFYSVTAGHSWTAETGETGSATTVYPNHWGASTLRATLKSLLSNTDWFTNGEADMLAEKIVTTQDQYNGSDYTTRDKLWCGWTRIGVSINPHCYLSTTQGATNCAVYTGNWEGWTWTRARGGTGGSYVACWLHRSGENDTLVNMDFPSVSAAFELDTTNFAFMAAASTSETGGFTKMSDDSPLRIRKSGGRGTVTAEGSMLTYSAPAGSRLMIIASDGTNNYQYCKKLASAVSRAHLDLSSLLTGTDANLVATAWIEESIEANSTITSASEPVTLNFTNSTVPSSVFITESGLAALSEKYPDGLYAENAGLEAGDEVKIHLGRRPQDEYYYGGSNGSTKTTAPKGDITWRFAGKDGDNGGYIFYSEQPIVGCEQYMGTSRIYGLNSRFLQGHTGSKPYYNPNKWAPVASKGEHFDGGSTSAAQVYANHWGGTITRDPSTNAIFGIRGTLAAVLSNTDWFKSEEAGVMATKLVTTQVGNSSSAIDTTADKLWCGWGKGSGPSNKTYYLSTTQGTENCAVYLNNWDGRYWLRSADPSSTRTALSTSPGNYVHSIYVNSKDSAVSAAFELDTSSFAFMTSASPSETGSFTQIIGGPMRIRLTGGGGSVRSHGNTLIYSAPAGSRLMAIAIDGTNNYQYCKSLSSAVTDATLDLSGVLASGTSYSVKAWIEQDVSTGSTVSRASDVATFEIKTPAIPHSMFITHADLAGLSAKYPSGLYAENAGLESDDAVKIYLGRRPQDESYCGTSTLDQKTAPEGEIAWRFAGKDGDNGYIFYSEQPIVGCYYYMSTQRDNDKLTSVFSKASKTTVTWATDDGGDGRTMVNSNHWGPSTLRRTLKSLLGNTSWFQTEEAGVMAEKSVTTLNTSSNVNDTTQDKLWCGWAEDASSSYKTYYLSTTQGAKNCAVYASNWDGMYWLRSAHPSNPSYVDFASYYNYISYVSQSTTTPAVSAAFELDTTDLAFMAAASAGTTGFSQVASGAPLRMRLKGGVGSVSTSGNSVTYSGAPSGSRLMAVLSDGTTTYQYCQTVSGSGSVDLSAASGFPFAANTYSGRVWLEQNLSGSLTLATDSVVIPGSLSSIVLGSSSNFDNMGDALTQAAVAATITIADNLELLGDEIWDATNLAQNANLVTLRNDSSAEGAGFTLANAATLAASDLHIDWSSDSKAAITSNSAGAIDLSGVTAVASGTQPIIKSDAGSTATLNLKDVNLLSNTPGKKAIEWNSSADINISGASVATIELGESAGNVNIPNRLEKGFSLVTVRNNSNNTTTLSRRFRP